MATPRAPTLLQLLQRGLRVWLVVFCACTLTISLFLAPYLASHHDFGHHHPEGTPEHVHTVSAVLGSATAPAAPLTLTPWLTVVFLVSLPNAPWVQAALNGVQQARAPPSH
ncbi:MAG: hypothetical protein M3511_12295 [Deinococcota bacterium]|nr:hypothetical protein [Deinococcota bacterium]